MEAVTLKDYRTEETFRLPVDGVFVAVGIRPQTELVRGLKAIVAVKRYTAVLFVLCAMFISSPNRN